MIICRNCGVELEQDIEVCPLCETPVSQTTGSEPEKPPDKYTSANTTAHFEQEDNKSKHKRAVWELVTIIVVLLILATSVINYIINQEISWSEYPLAVYLMVFAYITSFAFLKMKSGIQLLVAFAGASVFIFVLDSITNGSNWALRLGIPLLFFTNLVFTGLMLVFRISRQRGINLIAYSFLAVSLLCVFVEAIIDLFLFDNIRLTWSLIASACILPVAAVLLFMHFRMKKGRDLNKTFHI